MDIPIAVANRISTYAVVNILNEWCPKDEAKPVSGTDATSPFSVEIREFESQDSTSGLSIVVNEFVGAVYWMKHEKPESTMASEVSLGIVIRPSARRKGIGSHTVRHVLELAFSELKVHRVISNVIGSDAATTESILRFFVGLGFSIETTKRRSLQSTAVDDRGSAWRDVYSLCMIDTEWFFEEGRAQRQAANAPASCTSNASEVCASADESVDGTQKTRCTRRSRWDEMLSRHQTEQEALSAFDSLPTSRISKVSEAIWMIPRSTGNFANADAPFASVSRISC